MFVNQVEKEGIALEDYEQFLKLLAPFAPHLTSELWVEIGKTSSIHSEDYPVADDSLAVDELVTIGVQINGKMRGTITVAPSATEAEVLLEVTGNEEIQTKLQGAEITKVIYVAGRILNLIAKEDKS